MNDALIQSEGPVRPPLANGELVFAAPWEGRVFGMAHALADAGVFTWDEFRGALIGAIHRWEADAAPSDTYSYYACFTQALETLLAARGLCDQESLITRIAALATRVPGHDHHHDHDHHDHHEADRAS